MQIFGILVAIGGAVLIYNALTMSVSVTDVSDMFGEGGIKSIVNMDLIAQRSDRTILGAAISIMGCMLYCAGVVVEDLKKPAAAELTPAPKPDEEPRTMRGLIG